MSAYIKRLQAADQREVEENNRRRQDKADATRERLSPLQDRLARLLQTIPVELQREGLALAVLQTSLKGRWRGSCHPGELGTALRRAGFVRRRRWSSPDGFGAVWCRTTDISEE